MVGLTERVDGSSMLAHAGLDRIEDSALLLPMATLKNSMYMEALMLMLMQWFAGLWLSQKGS